MGLTGRQGLPILRERPRGGSRHTRSREPRVGGAVDLHAGTATLDDDGTFLVDIAFTEYPSQTVSADGALVEDFPDTSEMKATMRLSWSGSKWKVEGVQIDDFDEQQ